MSVQFITGFNSVLGYNEYDDESCTAGFDDDIESTAKGFQLVLCIPNVFYKHLIGTGGETKKRIENETRTKIKIPRQHERGDVGNCSFAYVMTY